MKFAFTLATESGVDGGTADAIGRRCCFEIRRQASAWKEEDNLPDVGVCRSICWSINQGYITEPLAVLGRD